MNNTLKQLQEKPIQTEEWVKKEFAEFTKEVDADFVQEGYGGHAQILEWILSKVSQVRAEAVEETLKDLYTHATLYSDGSHTLMRSYMIRKYPGIIEKTAAGDIEAAQRTADRAIDLKYKDREAVYTTKLNQYNRIKDLLSEDEKKRGKALEYALNKEATALKEVKDFQKTILNNAISMNAPQKVLNAITNSNSIEEITKAGAGYLKSRADILDENLKIAQTASANRANLDKELYPTLEDNSTNN